MNAVFEPSLLFVSDADWADEDKQDAFLEHLLNHLEAVEEHGFCKIWWTDELQTALVGAPNMHPWFQSDLSNPFVVAIHQKFYARTEEAGELEPPCGLVPQMSAPYANGEAQTSFLKLAHWLVEMQEDFYLCLGQANCLPPPSKYVFDCLCHNNSLSPESINDPQDWLPHINVSETYFPASLDEFDQKFEKGLALQNRKMFGGSGKKHLFEFEFSKSFKKSIIGRTEFKEEVFAAIVKKLVFTAAEAKNTDLQDEFLAQSKQWRIRVTQRPSSTRIHYEVEGKKLCFLRYYGRGEHDDGL